MMEEEEMQTEKRRPDNTHAHDNGHCGYDHSQGHQEEEADRYANQRQVFQDKGMKYLNQRYDNTDMYIYTYMAGMI